MDQVMRHGLELVKVMLYACQAAAPLWALKIEPFGGPWRQWSGKGIVVHKTVPSSLAMGWGWGSPNWKRRQTLRGGTQISLVRARTD